MRLIDLTGQRFTRLLVLRRGENSLQGQARWICVCDCGKEIQVRGTELTHGKIKSCGCLLSENAIRNGRELWTTHGLISKNVRLYRIWKGMKGRCYNSNAPEYKHYGGKGVRVCDD